MSYRIEKDSIGEIKVLEGKLWGAQTQRSIENFNIGSDKMPMEVILAFAILKKAAAKVNCNLQKIDKKKAKAIMTVCDEISAGKWNAHFPLKVWQTGSGTQTHMNVNEVIANRANELLKEAGIENITVHPNDDVNYGQSSNDTFPTAMHIAAVLSLKTKLLPSIEIMKSTLQEKSNEFSSVVKIGRTHLQDATPLTLGQEVSGWHRMVEKCEKMILDSIEPLMELAIGGTAVGTGVNTHPYFDLFMVKEISRITGLPFKASENKFQALTSHNEIVYCHGALKALAADAMKIANDVRWLASGPRCGIGEISIPANEPGSSIMPGKVNPTQSEALTMIAVQIMGNDATIGFAASQGNFELNVFKPVIIYNFLQSSRILADGITNFTTRCLNGITANEKTIKDYVDSSLMLVTALNPYIGYEKAAEVAKYAFENNISLKEATLKKKYLKEEQFDQIMQPKNMINPQE
ncbi:fumarate hydratase, class II [Lottiidibacillus patelloidae]|uniref:Fumarate hydratase class II n=1 Tax=Lottiidibacillus patelloidae TaxID=2670334 RepID=A0A263BUQ5_9BACI|nr:class II fumarate hydratase [Lottiidibacillus patelloidae]OZM57464.1 fumarate hydratase, class II [Lottiidibacillus patelloidae]